MMPIQSGGSPSHHSRGRAEQRLLALRAAYRRARDLARWAPTVCPRFSVDEVERRMRQLFRTIVLIASLSAIALSSANADEARKQPRIGEVFVAPASVYKPYDEALREGLHSLGYVDGKNITIIARYADGNLTRVPALLKELISNDVDVLVVSVTAVQAAMQATQTIPIVAPAMADPIRDGLVSSLAHPGGNLTGGTGMGPDADTKRLQFALELVPGLKRLGLLFEATNAQFENGAVTNRRLANDLGLSLHTYGVRNLDEIRTAFPRFDKDRIQALIVWPTPLMLSHRQTILEYTSRKIPVIGEGVEFYSSIRTERAIEEKSA